MPRVMNAKSSNAEMTQMLLEYGAELDSTTVCSVARRGDTKILEMLINHVTSTKIDVSL